ncbi:hypothetical protein [uncultured Methylibium sp.]|uniref:hypothetical protein n=1 Tax=uncultured Methylibium sp. TaxID=381093 RepID=UPI0025D68315|nr:hypothetical protein [uncultured Methylibium sp.]
MRPRVDRRLAALLLVALLWAQALGLAHRTTHGLASAAHATAAIEAAHASDSPFGHDESEAAQCRLFDQLALGEPLAASGEAPAAVAGSSCAAAPAVRVAATSSLAAYLARAPPTVG